MNLKQIKLVCDRYAVKHRVAVAVFLGRCDSKPAFELLESNPGLGMLLAYGEEFGVWAVNDRSQARVLVTRPRTEILSYFGFPLTRSTVKIVGKVDAKRISVDRLFKLSRLLCQQGQSAKQLCHLDTICDAVIDILWRPSLRNMVSFPFLREIARNADNETDVVKTLADIGRVWKLHGISSSRIRSLKQLNLAWNNVQLMEVCTVPNRRCFQSVDVFPRPPITVPLHTQPAELLIEPILSSSALYEEAKSQKMRIDEVVPYVVSGDVAFYRLIRPERATVMVRRSQVHDGWVIRNIMAAYGLPVSRETKWAVAAYLSHRQDLQSEPNSSADCDLGKMLESRQGAASVSRREPSRFPLPPVTGSATIIPLTTESELKEEAEEQDNCVGMFSDYVKYGKRYFYRVLVPERATLALRCCGIDGWRCWDIRCRENKPVGHQTLKAVNQWLACYKSMS